MVFSIRRLTSFFIYTLPRASLLGSMDTTNNTYARSISSNGNDNFPTPDWQFNGSQLQQNRKSKMNGRSVTNVFPNAFSDAEFEQISMPELNLKRFNPTTLEENNSDLSDMSSWDYMMNVPIRVYNDADTMDPFPLDTIPDSSMDMPFDPLASDYGNAANFPSVPSSLGSNHQFITTPPVNGSNEPTSAQTNHIITANSSPSGNAGSNASASMSVPPPLTPSASTINDQPFSNSFDLPSQVVAAGTGAISDINGNPFSMNSPPLDMEPLPSISMDASDSVSEQLVKDASLPSGPFSTDYLENGSDLKRSLGHNQKSDRVSKDVSPQHQANPSTLNNPLKTQNFDSSKNLYTDNKDSSLVSPTGLQSRMEQNPEVRAHPMNDSATSTALRRSHALGAAADSLLPQENSAQIYDGKDVSMVNDNMHSDVRQDSYNKESIKQRIPSLSPPMTRSYNAKHRPSLVLGTSVNPHSLSPSQPPVVVPSNTTISSSPPLTSPVKTSANIPNLLPTSELDSSNAPHSQSAATHDLNDVKSYYNTRSSHSVVPNPTNQTVSITGAAADGPNGSAPVDTTPTNSSTTATGAQRKRRKFKFGKQIGPVRCTLQNRVTGEICNTVFSRTYDLIRHQDTIHAKTRPVFRCEICGDQRHFSRHDALVRHLRVKHGR